MQLIAFSFEKISAEKHKQPSSKLEINTNIHISSLEEEKVPALKDKSAFKFSFDLNIAYKPDLASLFFKGTVLIVLEKDKAKELIKDWSNKKIPEDIQNFIYNIIFTRCNLKALQLEEDLILPFHFPLPRLEPSADPKTTGYAG